MSVKQVWVRIYGDPKAQPRPRMTKSGHAYNPDSADAWKEEIAWNFKAAKAARVGTMTKAVGVDAVFYLPRPKRMKLDDVLRTHKKKPDIDNLLKAVFDAITASGIWEDDSQIAWATGRKYYEIESEAPGVHIRVWELPDEE